MQTYDIRTSTTLSSRILVAGGGAGGGTLGNGGAGGQVGATGAGSGGGTGGTGGTASAGGIGGVGTQISHNGSNGSLGQGGNANGSGGGGGGGGFYGGGGGCYGSTGNGGTGGGGGSSYADAMVCSNVTYTTGGNTGSGSLVINWDVITCSAPIINSQPLTTQTVCQTSETTALTVNATDPNSPPAFTDPTQVVFRGVSLSGLTYQWYSNASNSNAGGTIISGATNATFTPPSINAGTVYYYCVVTSSCDNTTATSNTAKVIINALPTLSITGSSSVAQCSTITLAGLPTGGTWSSNAISKATIGSTNGIVTGVAVGGATIKYTFTDINGCTNNKTLDITVTADVTPPTFTTCPSDISVNNDLGNCSAVVTYTTPTASDNCGTPNVVKTAGLAGGSSFPVGLTTNTFTATDGSNNSATCTFKVSVTDNEKPKITCPTDISIRFDASICDSKVNYTVSATDNCSATVNQTAGLPNGGVFPLGKTVNTFYASDVAENTSAPCSFNVFVIDEDKVYITQSPLANYTACPKDNVTLTAAAYTFNRAMTVKWQKKRLTDADFIDVTTATPYKANDNTTYTVSGLALTDDGVQYRAVFTSCFDFVTSPTKINVISCPAPIGLRAFPQGLPDCLKDAFRNLEKIYNNSDGANWKRGADKSKSEAWFTANMSNWYGVTLTPDGCDVASIDLSNNLKKFAPDGFEYIVNLPESFEDGFNQISFPRLDSFNMSSNNLSGIIYYYNFPNLKVLNLRNNKLINNVPDFKDCPKLQKLLLDTNQLSGNIPNFNQLKLDTIGISTNNFIFGDFAKKNWLSKDSTHKLSISYAPQALIPLTNTNGVLSVFTGEPDSIQRFKWFRIGTNNDTSLLATTRSHTFTPAVSGIYFCQITHDTLTRPNNPKLNLILKTSNLNVGLSLTVPLSGSIKSENSQAVANVTVNAVETLRATSLQTNTDANGDFTASVLRGATYQARATKTSVEDKFSGVSTYDIALISKHILGIETLNSPYKIIAADVDKSNEVDAADMLALRRFILNIDKQLPAGVWRFVDKSYVFKNAQNPFGEDFPEVANINLITGTPTANFVAVKIGDVNQNYTPAFGKVGVRSAKTIELKVDDQQLQAGKEYTVKIGADNFNALALQGTFQFKEATVKALKAGNLTNMSDENFGMFSNAVTTSWNGKSNASVQMVEITFVANTNSKLSDVLTFGSSKTPSVANDANGNEADVVIRYQRSGISNQAPGINIVPNPAKSSVTIVFDNKNTTYIRLLDLLGREMDARLANSNSTDFDISQYAAGCYIIEVTSNGERFVQKLMKE